MKVFVSRKAARITAICVSVVLVSIMLTQLVLAGSPTGGSVGIQSGDKQLAETQLQPRPSSPSSYTLQGDFANSGSSWTEFSSSTNSGGSLGAWRFYATGTGETALRARCSGGSLTCKGTNFEGEAYGTYSKSNNTSRDNTSIGVYGLSLGTEGQGVAGQSNSSGGFGGVFTATGLSGIGVQATSEKSRAIYGVSGVSGVYGGGSAIVGITYSAAPTSGVEGYSSHGDGIIGQTYGNSGGTSIIAGVYGVNYMYNGGLPIANAGVSGYCSSCNGVFGRTYGYVGVRGIATGPATSYGGYFTATLGTALYGNSSSGFGVYGYSTSSYGLSGGSSSGFGVRGASSSNYGLYVTTATGPAAGYVKTTAGLVGLRAVNPDTTASHYAIISDGNVQVNGTLHATGGITAVSSTDQGERQMYAGLSTQSLSSDEGTATLVNGRAIVKIDPLFAQTVDLAGGYRVFAMPHSFDTVGLGVGNMTSTGFEVRELNKGNANFSFDWRITAVRKGYEKQRMEAAPSVPVDNSVLDKQSPSDLAPPELSNTPPPVVAREPNTLASGEVVALPGTAQPGGNK